MLIELRENRTNVQVCVSLNFGSLETGLNRQGFLQEIQSSSHFADSTIIASHIIECHSHA
jgi:hypothetical protein